MNWKPLLHWYEKEGRDLPWRKTRDPYRILVSEMMLQQTQVSRVLIYYKIWLRRFPTWHALAKASNTEIVHAWAGLGYNRRGLMLRDIAREVVKNRVPRTEEEWRALKGVGPYTAAALTSFSLGQAAVPIDTNIRRALGRILLGKPFPTFDDDPRIRSKAALCSLFSVHYQALFDLAVAICKKSPDCAVCPMRSQCPTSKKFLSSRVRIPKRMIKKAFETKHRDKPHPDRIYRGRILALVRTDGPVSLETLGPRMDPDFDRKQDQAWLKAMVARLHKDALIIHIDKNRISI